MHILLRNPGALWLGAFVATAGLVSGAEKSGEQIYRQHCARCHGAAGEGTKKYEKTLAGNKELPMLAR